MIILSTDAKSLLLATNVSFDQKPPLAMIRHFSWCGGSSLCWRGSCSLSSGWDRFLDIYRSAFEGPNPDPILIGTPSISANELKAQFDALNQQIASVPPHTYCVMNPADSLCRAYYRIELQNATK